MQISYGPWILETDSCQAVIPPDWGGDGDAGGGEPGAGGFGGAGGPGSDSCSPSLDPDAVHGPWQLLIDECRADYTAWENYTLVCHWDAGPPHNRRMEGREIWRRLKSVTAEGETLGPPEFVSTSCWTGKIPVPPTAVVTETMQTEAMISFANCSAFLLLLCGVVGFLGSLGVIICAFEPV